MRLKILCVRDSAMGAFAAPMAFPTTAVAHRAFTAEVNSRDASKQIVANPEDFELWYVADFDDETGAFMPPEDGVLCVARGKDVKQG